MKEKPSIEEMKKCIKLLNSDGSTLPSLKEMLDDPELRHQLVDEKEIRQNIGSYFKTVRVEARVSCLAPTNPPCKGKAIGSHSIQKSGPVKLLANSGNHVLMMETKVHDFLEGPKTQAELVGVNEATVFPGLCAKHDNEIFAEIDVEFVGLPSEKQCLLLGYRALLKELYAKKKQDAVTKLAAKSVSEKHPNSPMHAAMIFQAYQTYLGVCFVERMKAAYEQALQNGLSSSSLRISAFLIGRKLSYSCSGFFTPKFDFEGNPIRSKGDPMKVGLPFVSLSVIPEENSSVVVLIWNDEDSQQISGIISDDLWSTETMIEKSAWELALRNVENIIIDPEKWNALEETQRESILGFFHATIFSEWIPWCGVDFDDNGKSI